VFIHPQKVLVVVLAVILHLEQEQMLAVEAVALAAQVVLHMVQQLLVVMVA
jgi:hypothetical protein